MTGDDSYHAHCFKCKICKNRIDELVFAKTSQGIYCMDCHNERMIKIRKHNEKKAAQGSSSSRNHLRENGVCALPVPLASPYSLTLQRSASPDVKPVHSPSRNVFSDSSRGGSDRSLPRRPPDSYVSDVFDPGMQPSSSNYYSNTTPAVKSSLSNNTQSISVTVAPPDSKPALTVFHPPPRESSFTASEQTRLNPVRQNTVPVSTPPLEGPPSLNRRKSYDDGTRPLDILLKSKASNLDAPTSRKEKRRSINPGLVLNDLRTARTGTPPLNSPTPSQPYVRTPTPPTHGASSDRESLKAPSPLNEQFPDPSSNSRPPSNSSNYCRPSSTSPHGRDSEYSRQRGTSGPSYFNSQEHTVTRRAADEPLSPRRDSLMVNGGGSSSRPTSPLSSRPRGFSATGSIGMERQRSNSRSRPSSRADVPYSVESGTDGEADDVEDQIHRRNESVDSVPPIPPPKEVLPAGDSISRTNSASAQSLNTEGTSDVDSYSHHDSSDDMSESSPVEQVSHSTFIAPALPPIRFSMNTGDFSDLFSSVGGLPSLKSLTSISEMQKGENSARTPSTPPPTATSWLTNGSCPTPTSDVTIIGSLPSSSNDSRSDLSGNEDAQTLNQSTRYVFLPFFCLFAFPDAH